MCFVLGFNAIKPKADDFYWCDVLNSLSLKYQVLSSNQDLRENSVFFRSYYVENFLSGVKKIIF